MSLAPSSVAEYGDLAAEWASTQRVVVGPWNVRYREAGNGPPIVLVHGLGVSSDYWFRNAPPLAAAGYRILAPDLPGFGHTDGPAGGLSVTAQAGALVQWADAMRLGPAVYVGHSLSCQAALQLAADEPDRVRGLVLAAPTGAPGKHRLLAQARGLFLDAWREPWPLFPLLADAYLRAGPVRYWNTWRSGARHEPLKLLPRVTAPVCVVVGTRDPVVPLSFAQALAAGCARGEIVWIAGAAHAVLFDRSGAFNAAVLGFLAREVPSAAEPATSAKDDAPQPLQNGEHLAEQLGHHGSEDDAQHGNNHDETR